MNDIQTDLSEQAQFTAISANLCEFFQHLARSRPEFEGHFENAKFTRWHTPLAHPWFNGALCSGPFEEADMGFVADTIEYFRKKGVGIFTWWLEPPLQASAWEPALAKQGFRLSNNTTGMALALESLEETAPALDGLEIRAVEDDDDLRTWVEVFTKGYGLPTAWMEDIFDVLLRLGLEFPIKNYLGLLHGKAVSTSALFYGGGVAGIYNVSTVPEARGQGIGAALTHIPLLEARERGYHIGILQSSQMGFAVYRRLGFKHLGQIQNFYRSLARE
jgi:ribosomal protein S18 acetylase RimI-like enzyme